MASTFTRFVDLPISGGGDVTTDADRAGPIFSTMDVIQDDDVGRTLNGSNGADTINGYGGNDSITGGLGLDSLNGGADDDIFAINASGEVEAGEIYEGGSGTDTIQYNDYTGPVSFVGVTLSGFESFYNYGGTVNLTAAQFDQFTTNLYGVFDLRTTGSVTIGAGATFSSVQLRAHDGGNTINLAGAAGFITFFGGNGADNYVGLDGSDVIHASLSADTQNGGLGNDTFYLGAGATVQAGDLFIGGDGTDTMQQNGSSENLNFVGATISGMENFYAYGGAVVMTADQLDSFTGTLYGIYTLSGAGSITLPGTTLSSFTIYTSTLGNAVDLTGAGGNARMEGGAAADTLIGSDGGDNITGGMGADSVMGGLGNDTLYIDLAGEIAAGDVFDGGADTDTLISNAPSPVNLAGATIANIENVYNYGALMTLTAAQLGGFGGTLYGQYALSGAGTADLSGSTLSSFVLTLSDAGNNVQLAGSTGSGVIIGGNGADTVTGGTGILTVRGSAGVDRVTGSSGNDIFTVSDAAHVTAGELYDGAGGVDAFEYAGGSGALSFAASTLVRIESFYNYSTPFRVLMTPGQISGFSGTLYGHFALTAAGTADLVGSNLSSFNLQLSDFGNTVNLIGIMNFVTVLGGAGNDTYIVTHASHTLTEAVGAGIDTVYANVTFTLAPNFDNLTLTGPDPINGTGNELNNLIIGNGAANTLLGLLGNDTLNGGGGADTLTGHGGNDAYVVDVAIDQVIEAAGEGADTVYASVSYALAAGQSVEVLRTADAAATAAINLTGNEVAQYLLGNAGANALNGLGGADTMAGAGGNDAYAVDSAADQVIEAGGQGTDTVLAGVSYALAAGQSVEDLRTSATAGTAAIHLTGNEVAQRLYGNAGANALNGLGGADTMSGGAGNDSYAVDNVSDRVVETAGQGTDTVLAGVSYALAAGQSVEDLRTTATSGTSPLNLTGNEAAQHLYGNAGHNALNGLGGADTMTGFRGDDAYIVDSIADQVIEAAGQGSDTVLTGVSYALGTGQSVEDLRTTNTPGTGAINLTGNELGQNLYGNAGVNRLNGMGGADTMTGFRGDDRYAVDDVADRVVEAANQGTDTVYATVSYTLGAGQSVEILRTGLDTGTTAIDLTGNELANTIVGNAGINILDGAGGRDVILVGGDTAADTIRFTAVGHSSRVNRDTVTGLDFNEDKLDFTIVPSSAPVLVSTGALNEGAAFDGNLATAVNAALVVNGAVLFDPNGGNLNLAGHAYLVVDANGDGNYTAGADYVVQLVDFTGTLDLDDFV